jgi:hypothetical protein
MVVRSCNQSRRRRYKWRMKSIPMECHLYTETILNRRNNYTSEGKGIFVLFTEEMWRMYLILHCKKLLNLIVGSSQFPTKVRIALHFQNSASKLNKPFVCLARKDIHEYSIQNKRIVIEQPLQPHGASLYPQLAYPTQKKSWVISLLPISLCSLSPRCRNRCIISHIVVVIGD